MENETQTPKYLETNADGSVTVTLSREVQLGGKTVKAVTLREPSVDDQLAADMLAGSGGRKMSEINLLANLAGAAPNEIRALKLRDYLRLQTGLSSFLD